MKQSFQIDLPYPPSVNNYWHQRVMTIKGRAMATMYVSEVGKQFRESVVGAVLQRVGKLPNPEMGRIGVEIVLHAPDRRARDIDNVVKPLLDAITAAKVWGDDSQIDRLSVQRGEICRTNPRAEVLISVLAPAEKGLFNE